MELGGWRIRELRIDLEMVCGSGVERGFDGEAAALKHVGVDHGGFDIFVSKKLLHSADTCPEPQVLGVITVLQEVGGEGMPKGVRGNLFIQACKLCGFANSFLGYGFIEVVVADDTSERVGGAL